ncbi:RsmB/NOP family class I SAM-dependent RNA methyltransferase [Sediminicurvatus halobius]|uniref:RNA methyltransferase n=1 Tax=Sediminicurvatus halobius TaxID=2182432 RepID=A0A2U2N6F5_9GAMM|nr:RsmB/NOP family class I SAM-dependent RNA methyltransferase [Spiribacter halobius]PWG64667.1 RNA methyltransferase [Spiribacter halobius]UEX79009.1 class I SAM-dependent methyltransferase [Spiribacter halobius]
MDAARQRAERAFQRYRGLIPDWPAFLDCMTRPLPATVWANPLRTSRDAVASLLAEAGYRSQPLAWDPLALRLPADFAAGSHWGLLAGLYQSQEEVSRLPVHLLDPQPGERVLDLCAAPGNKTAQMAVAMANTGTVAANDVQRGRLTAVRQVVKRLGLVNVSTLVRPGQEFPLRAGAFDRVLVDAPCSCEGTWRKGAWRREDPPREVDSAEREWLAARQLDLLRRALQICSPGGRIVYSTCTFAPEENEAVVDALLREAGASVALRPARVPGFPGAPGITDWQGRRYDVRLEGALRAWPHAADSGGFFVAVLEKLDGRALARVGPGPVPPSHPVLERIQARFDLPADAFAGLVCHGGEGRYLNLLAADHRWPRWPAPETTGLPAVGLQVKPPKPTTALAMALGDRARCNRVELGAAAAEAFRQRRPLSGETIAGGQITGPGHVLVAHRGYTLGVGRWTAEGMLESQFPKAWKRNLPV